MTVSEIATVLAWHDALNAHDLDTLVELSTGDIEIGDAGSPQTAASAFRVVHDKVTSVYRHDDLRSALAATELTEADLTDG